MWSVLFDPPQRAVAGGLSVGAVVASAQGQHWIALLAGLTIGVLARWAILQTMDTAITWRMVRIDALIFPANALLAGQFVELSHVDGLKLPLSAALFGASSTMIFAGLHAKFLGHHKVDRGGLILEVGPTEPGAGVPNATQKAVATAQVVTPVTPATPAEILIAALEREKPVSTNDAGLRDAIYRLGKIKGTDDD